MSALIKIRILSFLFLFIFSFPLMANEEIQKKFEEHIFFSQTQENKIGYLFIGGKETAISESTWLYVKAALDFYKKEKPCLIVLELNTPGGEVFAAEKISDALKEMDTQYGIPVVAYINNWAISAGALLAYSCRFIAIVKDGSMGAAEPVMQGSSGQLETASEKVNSAFRTDFAAKAQFFDRNPFLAEAMVDKNVIIVKRGKEIVKLDSESEIRLDGSNKDLVISSKGKLLTLTADQLIDFKIADVKVLPEKVVPLTASEEKTGLWPADKILLFHAPFFREIPKGVIVNYQMDWKTAFFVFLANPVLSSLLVLGVLVGFYLEFSTPGMAVFGSLATVCLFLLILSSFSLQLGGWLEVILIVSGLVVLVVELFILPTFGLLGFFGIVSFFGGLLGLFLPSMSAIQFDVDSQTLNAAGAFFLSRLAWFSLLTLLAFVIIALLAWYVRPSWKGFSGFVLMGKEQIAKEGFVAGAQIFDLPEVGSLGVAFSELRPSGKIQIENKILDAISRGGFLEKGTKVKVVKLEGSVVVVKACL